MSGSRNKIFISYRREDSSGHVGRLHDALTKLLGPNSVFMDIDSIAPGADFVQVLHHSLEQAAVVVVVMGGRWAGPRPDGSRRIDDPNDFVRLEVAKALTDREVRVIPVLVNKADMVNEADLPDVLKGLARRNAIEISDIRWAHDTKVLADEIAKTPGESGGPSLLSGLPTSVKLIGAAVALMLILFLWKPWKSDGNNSNSNSFALQSDNPRVNSSGIPAAPEMKMPSKVLSETRSMLKQVRGDWNNDAFVDEIFLDCRSSQCREQVKFVSPKLMQGLTASRPNPDQKWSYINERGTVTWGTDPMPLNVLDFEDAVALAQQSGMVGPISTAVLGFYYPRGQTMLVWWITPKVFRNDGQRNFCFEATTKKQYDCNQIRS